MLLVARSRRMCCSRVDKVRTTAAPAVRVDGLADEPARHLSDEFVAAGEQAEIGPAEIQRIAERLAFGGDDVGAHLARGLHQAQGHDFG